MTATGHALIGTVIAAKIGNPALAAPIALASHFAADALPHWDTGYHRRQKSKRKFFVQSGIDVMLGFVLSYLLINFFFPSTNLTYAFFIILMAQLPDWLTAPYLFFDIKFAPFYWIYKFQKIFDRSLGMPWGVVNQVAAVILIIFLARFF
ncbi:MAG: hypothetical protein M1444_03255 [Patescibacteria group bacterium]|nr:hypothetical protein [Patescibacteria group bacterium]